MLTIRIVWKICYAAFGSGALSGKMLPVRIVINNKIDDYLGQVRLSKGYLCPAGLGKGLRYGPSGLEPPSGVRNSKKDQLKLFH